MKQYLYIIIGALALASCTKELFEDKGKLGDGKTITATFTLSPEIVEEIEVRSVIGVDERLIKDLWVIQLNEAGTAQLQEPQYITSLTAGPRDYKVAVSLVRSASRVYFIANIHDKDAYKGKATTTDIESVIMAVASEASIANADGIPMSGVWTGTPDLLGIAGQVSLSRAIAKVNFKLDASLPKGESFLLTSVQIKQVPNKLHGYRDAAAVLPFPASPTVINYDPTSYAKVNLTTANPQALWWYLPENARGTGTATVQGDKARLFPADQKAFCTYIEIAGLYEAAGGTYESIYKIYLGANHTTDYNLNRNTTYNVNTTIKGIDAADTRINMTDVSIIVGMFGGWDETKKEYTRLLEVQSVEAANDPILKWAEAASTTTANNKYYGVTNINKLKGLNPNLSTYPAAKYCEDKGNGWYLPSQNQLMAIWVAHNGISAKWLLSSNYYWSTTEYDSSYSWYLLFTNGYTDTNSKTDTSIKVRCVRDLMATETSQVVVVNNRVMIDNRGMNVEAITTQGKERDTQATNSATITDNSVNDIASAASNATVSHYFEVAKSDLTVSDKTWLSSLQGCRDYNSGDNATNGNWRLPTQRELQLIWILYETIKAKGVAGFSAFASNYYWSATENDSTTSWYVLFNNGYTTTANKTIISHNVRCIRDLTPKYQ